MAVSTAGDSVRSGSSNKKRAVSQSTSSHRQACMRLRSSTLNRPIKRHSAEMFRARKQVIKMLIAIIVAFLVCWGPKLVFSICMRVGFAWVYLKWAYHLKIVLFLLPFVHSCLNPIIYGFMSKNFRSRMRCSCYSLFHCRKSDMNRLRSPQVCAGIEVDTRSSNNGTTHTKINLRRHSSDTCTT
ncbi:cholecystokinin receptor [Elysia marginata]|uniref:Cholecystokinin receptor n=1 Tax=Elysia marginata TaxID=1093978 RepID=A0AAV4HDS9_9GAST|nr:cholecystokinin receptor [Elysia marginata]